MMFYVDEHLPCSILSFYFIIADPTTEVTMWANPPEKLLKEGDTLEIGCTGNGNPQPIFTFYKNKVTYISFTLTCVHWKICRDRDSTTALVCSFQNEVSTENELLVLKEVKRSDSGTYLCQIINFDTETEVEDSIDIMIHCKNTSLCICCLVSYFHPTEQHQPS